jgi:hypothetical protein
MKLALLTLAMAMAATAVASTNILELRIGSGERDVARYREYGYNAVVLGDITQLADYETVAPGVIAKNAALKKRIEKHRGAFQTDYDRANTLGLAVCLMTDEIELPTAVLDHFRKAVADPGKPQRINFDSPQFWELYRAKYREVLKAFPKVAYVIVRTGENYSHLDEGYTGHTVLDKTADEAYYRNMQRLIAETRKVVVDEFGRTLIWRTWDLGNNGFHANPAVYDRILEGVHERNGLVVSIKHTQTDFWDYNDFNPMIGRGGVRQVVEFQCAREYEGKGAFPNYVGPAHAEAMRQARDLGAGGVWIWDFGGGWGGPFLKSDRWVRLNIYATTQLAKNPEASPRLVARQWAEEEFGSNAAPKIADMLMLSPECVRKFMYIGAYAENHKGWMPSRNLMRDDIIRGERVLRENGGLKILYDGSRQSLDQALAEKSEAVELAAQMRAIFESARTDIVKDRGQKVYDESLGSLVYLESLAKVMSHYVRGMFLYYHWQETGNAATAAEAENELRAWRAAWVDYQTNIPKLPGVASLYRSQTDQDPSTTPGAMADTCEAALRSLVARTAPAQTRKVAEQQVSPGTATQSH